MAFQYASTSNSIRVHGIVRIAFNSVSLLDNTFRLSTVHSHNSASFEIAKLLLKGVPPACGRMRFSTAILTLVLSLESFLYAFLRASFRRRREDTCRQHPGREKILLVPLRNVEMLWAKCVVTRAFFMWPCWISLLPTAACCTRSGLLTSVVPTLRLRAGSIRFIAAAWARRRAAGK